MKNTLLLRSSFGGHVLLLAALLLSLAAQAQTSGFHYQAVVRDASGNPVINQPVTLRFQILYSPTQAASLSYQETQTTPTGNFGEVALVVGDSAPALFDTIQWNAGSRYLQVAMLVNGVFQPLGDPKEIVHPPFAGGKELWIENGGTIIYTLRDVGIGTSDINAPLTVQGAISSGSRILVGRNGTEAGVSLVHFKNGDDNNGGTIRASKGNDEAATAPMRYEAKSHTFAGQTNIGGQTTINGQTTIYAPAVGLPFANGNILDLASTSAPGALTFGKLNTGGDSYIQSSTTGTSSRLVLNPHGGGSSSVSIVGSVFGMPYSSGNILDLASTSAQGGMAFGKLNQAGDSYIQSFRDGASSNLYLNPEAQNTRVIVPALEITGGSDIIEKFQATHPLQPGEIALADPADPQHVVRSTRAYDRLVVGVVSGAGGINPGMELKQTGVLDGNTPIAIAGRLKVKVTGKVAPGDLLTTSNVPGHAMKVKNRRKAYGAVIGKALSYPDAEGLVLMLVHPQ